MLPPGVTPPWRSTPFWPLPYGVAEGVGYSFRDQEEPFPAVGAPYRCVRTKQTPLRAPPCFNFFQSSEDGVESPSKEPWDILHDDDFGSNLINDAEEVLSEPSLVGFAFPSAGDTEWLARDSRSDAMNDSRHGRPSKD